MVLPVAKINVKLGPTELGSEACSWFQAEPERTRRTSEVTGWFTNGCLNILSGHFYRQRAQQSKLTLRFATKHP